MLRCLFLPKRFIFYFVAEWTVVLLWPRAAGEGIRWCVYNSSLEMLQCFHTLGVEW